MSGPPYHLRKNKAADRFALIEAIRHLQKLGCDLEKYTYFGFGGPYLEDIRLIYEFCPEISMVSIEENRDVFDRQDFHLPCGKLNLVNSDIRDFISQYESEDQKSIFWLDYTRLEYTSFEDYITLLGRIAQGSMIKITLRTDPRDYWSYNRKPRKDRIDRFQKKFVNVLPTPTDRPSWKSEEFAYLVQNMLRIAAQQALPAEATPLTFYPVSSFNYSDGSWMYSLTGVIWPRNEKLAMENAFSGWEFANLTWERPRLIALPDLSTKERLHLQRFLPCDDSAPGETLQEKLGYFIAEDRLKTEEALEQYAAFHRYFPYFIRGNP